MSCLSWALLSGHHRPCQTCSATLGLRLPLPHRRPYCALSQDLGLTTSSSCQASSPPQATSRTASFLLTSLLQVFTDQSSFFFFSCHFVPVSLNLCPFPQGTRILSVQGKNKKKYTHKKPSFPPNFRKYNFCSLCVLLDHLNLLQMAFAPAILPLFPPRLASSPRHPKAFAQSSLFFTLL